MLSLHTIKNFEFWRKFENFEFVDANKNLAWIHFTKLTSDRSKKISVGTIPGISNYFTFIWPTGEQEGIIEAFEIPNYGSPKIYTIPDIKKLLKNSSINQLDPVTIEQTVAPSEWKINVPSKISSLIQYLTVPEVRSRLQENNLDSPGDKLIIKQRLDQLI